MDHIYYTFLFHNQCTKKINLFFHSQNIETVPYKKKNNHRWRPFRKMAAICVVGQICDGPVAEKSHTTILHVCAKFHAFITKGTIYFYICCTIEKYLLDQKLDHLTCSKCLFMTLLYDMYKTINFIPVYSQNCVTCQMV